VRGQAVLLASRRSRGLARRCGGVGAVGVAVERRGGWRLRGQAVLLASRRSRGLARRVGVATGLVRVAPAWWRRGVVGVTWAGVGSGS
jgi:hypothetical protein